MQEMSVPGKHSPKASLPGQRTSLRWVFLELKESTDRDRLIERDADPVIFAPDYMARKFQSVVRHH